MSDTLVNLPGGARARRAEEQRRLVSIEVKLDSHIKGAAKAAPEAPTPPRSPFDEALDQLSRNLANCSWFLHPAVSLERRMDEDCDRIESLTYDGVRLSLREAVELGLVTLDGRTNHFKWQAIAHAVNGRDERTTPARRLRW
jgi:hypothetical protein